MNIQYPLFKVRWPIAGSFFAGFLGSLLLIVSTAAAASFEEQLNRIENKLSLVKMDVLRLYQSGAIGSDRSSLPPSDRASGSSVLGQDDQKPPVPLQGEVDLQTIAALMKRMEPEVDPAAPSQGPGRLPTDEMRLLLADYFLQTNLISQAENTLKDISVQTRREPIAAEAWFRLEKLYYRKGDYQQALEAFYKIPAKGALSLRQEAAYLAGNSYLYLKDHLKAVELLGKIGEGSDFYPFALYSSGLAYLNLGDAWSATQQKFQTLIAFKPGEDPVRQELINKTRVTLGFFFIDQKRYPEAMSVFEAVPASSRYWTPARFGIGKVYIGTEDCVKAIVVLRDLIERTPTHPYALEARLQVGSCYSKLSAYRRAVDSYQDALKAYSGRSDDLKKLIQKIQTTNLENWLFKSRPGTSGQGPRPVSLEQDLIFERGFRELMDVYSRWFRLNEEISLQIRQSKDMTISKMDRGTAQNSKPLTMQMQDIRRDLIDLLRVAATDQLSSKMEQIDELALRANTGIAKNLTLMQDHETAP
jgi:tetratricopeptide (TPR) repeat protein